MDLRNVDFNLLLPLRALLEERNVSRAAERMGMSQPALSSSLARLRRHFDDPLLRRSGNSYELTALGVQLMERAQSATRSMERVFSAQPEFEPSTSTREFSILSSDYAVALLGGALVDLVAEAAPRMRVLFNHINLGIVDDFPDSARDRDGVLMPHGYLTGRHLDLFSDRWVCVVSEDNTLVGDELTVDHLAELPWVYAFGGRAEYTPAVRQMQMFGIEPVVQAVTASFLVLPSLLKGSNRIAFLHEHSARQLVSSGLKIMEVPFEVPDITEAFWWNSVHDRDPEHIWLRSMLVKAAAVAGLSPSH